MFDINELKEAETLEEALKLLNENNNFKIICGGTDILIKLRHGKMESVNLLSIRNIDCLKGIKLLEDNTISIGAVTNFSEIFRNEIINEKIPILSEAAVSMGGPQIRNIATIGGNICNGAVSADSVPALFALNALLKLKSVNGERIVEIRDFYNGPGKVKIDKNEILTEVLIKEKEYINKQGKYIKFTNRNALDISMLGVAIVCEENKGEINDLRIALGVAAPIPLRCIKAEAYGIGKKYSESVINNIATIAMNESSPRNSWRGSKDYRLHLIKTLIKKIMKEKFIYNEVNFCE